MGKTKTALPSDQRAGDGLGRYGIVGVIGVGGMARVHLAHLDGPGGFRKWVAIKRIHRHLAGDDTFVRMFLDEARVAARISHPNVAQVFELGRHRHTYWLAMEYLHGEPLHELMGATAERGCKALDPYLAARLIADAAEGLHAAHELRDHDGSLLNLVHRDVSPHNIFVTYDGAAKVVDFGIATGAGRLACTRVGTLKGKLAYMSPEQVRGRPLDRRADVFALGIVLWELTTGERLFRGETELETLERVQACRVPRPTESRPGFPRELETILLAALQKHRDRRTPTARDLARSLRRFVVRADTPVGCEEVSAHVREVLASQLRAREALLRSAPAPAPQPPSRTAPDLRPVARSVTLQQPRRLPAGPRPSLSCPSPPSAPGSTVRSASWLVPISPATEAAPRGHSATVRAGDPWQMTVPRPKARGRSSPCRYCSPAGFEASVVAANREADDDDDAVTRILRRNEWAQSSSRLPAAHSVRKTSRNSLPKLRTAGDLPAGTRLDRSERRRSRAGAGPGDVATTQPSSGSRRTLLGRIPLRLFAAATTALAIAGLMLLAV